MAEIESTRAAVIDALEGLMADDPRIVAVFADSTKVFRAGKLMEKFPARVFDVGIAEQGAVAFASGLAASGYIPFVGTYSGFLTMRACEQMRTFVAYPSLNVKFFGANGGIFGGEREGVTHQFTEDVGIMRAIAGFTVLAPADARETRKAIIAAAAWKGPVFIRVGSGRDPVLYKEDPAFAINKIHILDDCDSPDVALFSYGGCLLNRAREAAAQLKLRGIRSVVANVHTLKPLDATGIVALLKRVKAAVTVEDHIIYGGLGSAVAETIAEQVLVPLVRLGLRDVFGESGEAEQLLDAYGLSIADIMDAVTRALAQTRHHPVEG